MKFPKLLLTARSEALQQEFSLLCASDDQMLMEVWRVAEVFRDAYGQAAPNVAGLYLAELLEQVADRLWAHNGRRARLSPHPDDIQISPFYEEYMDYEVH